MASDMVASRERPQDALPARPFFFEALVDAKKGPVGGSGPFFHVTKVLVGDQHTRVRATLVPLSRSVKQLIEI